MRCCKKARGRVAREGMARGPCILLIIRVLVLPLPNEWSNDISSLVNRKRVGKPDGDIQ